MSDSVFALGVVGLVVLVLIFKVPLGILELLMKSRPVSAVAMLLVVLGLFYKNYLYTALAFAALSVLVMKDLFKYTTADARRLYQEKNRDLARFDPTQSIDLQFGNGTAKHDRPDLYVQPKVRDHLLIFPPSDDTLKTMCG